MIFTWQKCRSSAISHCTFENCGLKCAQTEHMGDEDRPPRNKIQFCIQSAVNEMILPVKFRPILNQFEAHFRLKFADVQRPMVNVPPKQRCLKIL